MKTIKFTSQPNQNLKPEKKKKIAHAASSTWIYKVAALTGVFFAAFFSIVIFNSQIGTEQNIATAEVGKNTELFYHDVSKFLQWMDIVRQNAWNNQPLLQPLLIYDYLDPQNLRGLAYPVASASLPLDQPGNMPNADRDYRNGIHEGVDFSAAEGTRVHAAYWGKIIRIDKNFQELTASQYQQMITQSEQASITPPEVLDKIRGRQIWIDHGNGVVTRYCHLSAVNANLVVGQIVNQGEYIGRAGSSGLKWTSFGAHLHFEIRIDAQYLGQGKNYQTIKELYSKAFAKV